MTTFTGKFSQNWKCKKLKKMSYNIKMKCKNKKKIALIQIQADPNLHKAPKTPNMKKSTSKLIRKLTIWMS